MPQSTDQNTNNELYILSLLFLAVTLQLIRLCAQFIQRQQQHQSSSRNTSPSIGSKPSDTQYGSITSTHSDTAVEESESLLRIGGKLNERIEQSNGSTTTGLKMLVIAWTLLLIADGVVWVRLLISQQTVRLSSSSSDSIAPSRPLLFLSTATFLIVGMEIATLLQWVHDYYSHTRALNYPSFVLQCTVYLILSIAAFIALSLSFWICLLVSAIIVAPLIFFQRRTLATLQDTIFKQMGRPGKTTTASLSRRKMIPLLQPYLWPRDTRNRFRVIGTWMCVVCSKLSNLVTPLYIGRATTALAHGKYTLTIQYVIVYAILGFASTLFKEGQSYLYLFISKAGFVQLSSRAFQHLHSLSLEWHTTQKKLGQVIRSMDRGIQACDSLMRWLCLWLVPALVEAVVVCIIFATYFQYPPLAVAVFYFVFVYIVWTILITIWRKKFRKELTQSDNDWHDVVTDSLMNFDTVKYFCSESFEVERFHKAVSRYQTGSVNVQASLAFLNISQKLILQACLACSLSLAGWGIKQRADCCIREMGCDSSISECCESVSQDSCPGMSVGDFVAVLSYTLNLFAPLNFLGSVYNSIVMSLIDLSHLSDLLAETPDVEDAKDALPLPRTNPHDSDLAAEFDNVHFRYPSQPIGSGLKGVSFNLRRGTTTAIVGPTGAGKTTISKLLFRFYDVQGGAVKVNGMDVRCVTQKSLRASIGVVPQMANMFNTTIRANLLYGNHDATQEELEEAARDAQLLGFIESLDEGWETVVGDQGLKLSGGERQRMAIARCLLKDPPFVLLDEATSALDTLTEASVQEALDRLGAERTVLVIAHRLGTVRNADNIIVLADGEVAEHGTHDELLAKNGTYADMWNRQLHTVSSVNSLENLTDLIAEASFSSPPR